MMSGPGKPKARIAGAGRAYLLISAVTLMFGWAFAMGMAAGIQIGGRNVIYRFGPYVARCVQVRRATAARLG